jgi:hypothetical protein
MRYNQIPFENLANVPTLQMQIRSSPFVRVQNRKRIILNMPLRMTTAALLDVARESIMPTRPECLAHFLALFASHQYVYNVTSFSFIQPPFIVPYVCLCDDTINGYLVILLSAHRPI